MKIGVLLVCLWGCTPLLDSRYETQVIYRNIPDSMGAVAFTACDTTINRAYVVFDTAKIGNDIRWIHVHEFKHVKDMESYPGGCVKAAQRYKTDENFRLDMEMRAECAAMHAEYGNSPGFDHAFLYNLNYYHNARGFPDLTRKESYKRFKKTCDKGG